MFLAIVAFVCCFFVGGYLWASPPETRRPRGVRAVGLMGGWLLWNALVALQLEAFLPVSLFVNLAFIIACTLALVASPAGATLARVPLAALVGFPIFRLPLEMVLHEWAAQGVIPVSMSWNGQNLDVVAGVLGPLGAGLMLLLPAHRRWIAGLTNTICLGFLFNVVRVAVLSAPLPIRIFGDPPLVLPLHVPTTWIVSICVAGALAGHLITYRALYSTKRA